VNLAPKMNYSFCKVEINGTIWLKSEKAISPSHVRWPMTELVLLSFCPHLDETSLELLGLDAVLAPTTFTCADAALGGPQVFGSFFKDHRR